MIFFAITIIIALFHSRTTRLYTRRIVIIIVRNHAVPRHSTYVTQLQTARIRVNNGLQRAQQPTGVPQSYVNAQGRQCIQSATPTIHRAARWKTSMHQSKGAPLHLTSRLSTQTSPNGRRTGHFNRRKSSELQKLMTRRWINASSQHIRVTNRPSMV